MAKRRRGRSGWIVGIIVLLGLIWVGYWYAAHYAAATALARIAAGPVNGRTIRCDQTALSGFPLVLDIRCTRGSYAEPGNQATAELGGITASAPLYRPGSVNARLDGPLTLNVPGRGVALTATWSMATATLGAWFDGLDSGSASFLAPKAENAGVVPGLPFTSAAAGSASGSFAPEGGGTYGFLANAKQVALTRADGTALPVFDTDMYITAPNFGRLGSDPARAVVRWLRGSPSISISRLRIATAGGVVNLSGTLSLSPQGLLNGSVLLRYNNIDGLRSLIEALRPGSTGDQKIELALQGLNSMSQSTDSPDGPARQTTLTFTDGLIWLTVIPLPIDPIPPIRF